MWRKCGKVEKEIAFIISLSRFFEGEASNKSGGGSYSEGLASISAVVKKGGHKVSLFHITRELNEKEFKKRYKSFKDVDIIGFSTRTTAFDYVKTID